MSELLKEGPSGLGSPLQSQFAHSYNPIQIAAISNYKLAQLTFAPPDLDSLRKTAIIKNVLEDVYTNTQKEWLQQMTRWQFFTAESLEEMTQEGLEEIFQQYSQTIEAFRPVKTFPPTFDDVNFEDEDGDDDDEQGDDLWVADEEVTAPTSIPKTTSIGSSSSLFSQPNTNLSNESIEIAPTIRPPSLFSDKPLPAYPFNDNKQQNQQQQGQGRRNSGFSTGNMNRLSWTSDTGITSNVVSQNLANEIMNLFDMDFSVDIKLNTAPKLPELPFRPRRRSQQRQSQDMLSSLIPAFEKIALENSINNNNHRQANNGSPIIRSVPQRSSSLKHRQEMEENANRNKIEQYKSQQPSSVTTATAAPKKKSRLRLSSLIIKKHKDHSSNESTSKNNNSHHSSNNTNQQQQQQQKHRKTSTSTIDSNSSSSWSYVSDVESKTATIRSEKPLPQAPTEYNNENNKEEESGYSNSFKKEKKTKKIKTKKMKKKSKQEIHKQTSSKSLSDHNNASEVTTSEMYPTAAAASDLSTTEYSHTTSEESIETLGISSNNFVKRMASFNWRIKSRGKVVEV